MRRNPHESIMALSAERGQKRRGAAHRSRRHSRRPSPAAVSGGTRPRTVQRAGNGPGARHGRGGQAPSRGTSWRCAVPSKGKVIQAVDPLLHAFRAGPASASPFRKVSRGRDRQSGTACSGGARRHVVRPKNGIPGTSSIPGPNQSVPWAVNAIDTALARHPGSEIPLLRHQGETDVPLTWDPTTRPNSTHSSRACDPVWRRRAVRLRRDRPQEWSAVTRTIRSSTRSTSTPQTGTARSSSPVRASASTATRIGTTAPQASAGWRSGCGRRSAQ